jgi:two-component system, chemotaxis family, sensor kinase CheA
LPPDYRSNTVERFEKGTNFMNELDSVIEEFLLESFENLNLDQLDRDLVTLEQDPRNQEDLANIFRTIHTIKGTCGFFNFSKLGTITHSGENLLSRMRDGELLLSQPIADGLLELVDSIREILANIENCGEEGNGDYSALVDRLTALQNPDQFSQATHIPASPELPTSSAVPSGKVSDGNIRVDVGLLDALMNRVGELVLARNQILQSATTWSDSALASTAQRLNLITSELQEGVMKTRMQPIRNIWDKFPRVVRDLAVTCG